MRDYSHSEILKWAREWKYISSDRVFEFDNAIRRPLQSQKSLHEATYEFIALQEKISPAAPDTEVGRIFRSLILKLEQSGEDVDRLYDWTLCLSSFLLSEKAIRALQIFKETFDRFARGRRVRATTMTDSMLEQLALSYAEHVYQPSAAFARRCRETREEWLEKPSRRSEFDDFLWDHYFEEIDVDPATILSIGYNEMLIREWWRRVRKTLSQDEREALQAEQERNILSFSRTKVPSWKIDKSIKESMLVDGIPEFSRVALPQS